jgi:hypothetical protein
MQDLNYLSYSPRNQTNAGKRKVAIFCCAQGANKFMASCGQTLRWIKPEEDIMHAESAWVVSDDKEGNTRTSAVEQLNNTTFRNVLLVQLDVLDTP